MSAKTMRLRRKAAPVLPEGVQAAIDDAVTTQIAASIQGLVDNYDRALFGLGRGIVELHFTSCEEQARRWSIQGYLADFVKTNRALEEIVLDITERISTPDLAGLLKSYYEDRHRRYDQYMAGLENRLLNEQKREEEEGGWSSRLDGGVRDIVDRVNTQGVTTGRVSSGSIRRPSQDSDDYGDIDDLPF